MTMTFQIISGRKLKWLTNKGKPYLGDTMDIRDVNNIVFVDFVEHKCRVILPNGKKKTIRYNYKLENGKPHRTVWEKDEKYCVV